MNILVDYHHHDLYESLCLLFEDRLGWGLYRPIGMEWFDAGYWNFERLFHGDAVAKQYLTPWGDDEQHDGYSTRLDKSHGRVQKMVTLEQARAMKWDVVMASVSHNHTGFKAFANQVGAKMGIHLGNVRFSDIDLQQDRFDLADFAIITTKLPAPISLPHAVVHQEFSLKDFHYVAPPIQEPFRISSFVNCFPENRETYSQFRATAEGLPELDWRIYGAYGTAEPDEYAAGNLNVCADVAQAMRDSDIAWHTKHWSDGFGHVVHNWFAVGRPVFGHANYYETQMAGPLWVEGVTSFDISRRTSHEVGNLIQELMRDPERHHTMSLAAALRFREVVNFDEEEQVIRTMLEAVL